MSLAVFGALVILHLVVPGEGRAGAVDTVARCGARKVDAMARACSDVLAAEARFLTNGSEEGFDRRFERARGRVSAAWQEAERHAGDSRCAARTEAADAAVDRLAAAVRSGIAEAGGPSCGRSLARLLRRLCRSVTRLETAALERPASAAAERARGVGRARDRIRSRWPAAGCPAPTTEAALDLLFELSGIAAAGATTRTLRPIAEQLDFHVGVAIEPGEVTADPAYPTALSEDATSLTAENVMKWGPIQPSDGVFQFGPSDELVARAENDGQRVRGHTLVWGAMQLPAYVRDAASGPELRGYVEDHITGVLAHYAGRVEQWDVVNEPLSSIVDPATPDGLDDNVFRRQIGPGYVAEAFHLARAADPNVELYLNENGLYLPGPRQDRFFDLVQELLDAGVPLDGVGFQAHVGLVPVYPDQESLEQSIRRFTDLGLDVELTELDVFSLPLGDLPERLEAQGRVYREIFAACLAVPRCRGITTWGWNDRYSWIRDFFGISAARPLPFEDDWGRKPAYFGMRAALLQALFRRAGGGGR